jgi:hypothetical protein
MLLLPLHISAAENVSNTINKRAATPLRCIAVPFCMSRLFITYLLFARVTELGHPAERSTLVRPTEKHGRKMGKRLRIYLGEVG